ncbi:hypothetical protein VTO42DRAFT_8228 [Malbranchea cinnamomea]
MSDAMETQYPNPQSSCELITSIIDELSRIAPLPDATLAEPGGEPSRSSSYRKSGTLVNPLSSLPADTLSRVKPLLLTLHCLFPNELLLALDILDKKLVRKCRIFSPTSRRQHEVKQPNSCENYYYDVYFVRSQSTARGEPGEAAESAPMAAFYEVHIESWNCTCPAFTLAAMHATSETLSSDEGDRDQPFQDPREESMVGWRFGGSLTRRISGMDPPAVCCKHLLASVLASRCPNLFAQDIERWEIELDSNFATRPNGDDKRPYEVAAWHAGWDK